MSTFIPAWYVLYTKPRHEKKVVQRLQESGISLYFPVVKVRRKWHDRLKMVEMPLFPSYIFVQIRSHAHFSQILSCTGSVCFVGFGKDKARIRDVVINDLRIVVDNSADVEVSPDYISPGKRLMIMEGPFCGKECEVVEYQRKQKIIVRIDLLNRSVLAMVSGDLLGAV